MKINHCHNPRRWPGHIVSFCLIALAVYATGKSYFLLTDGFSMSNIQSDLAYDPRWETRPLSESESKKVEDALSQPYFYLGKGCQSYVFGSEDGKYVIKFFKYQRFRPVAWLKYLSFIPKVDRYRRNKIFKKEQKREGLFDSWRLAFDQLQEETALLFVHLNKTSDLNKSLTIFDKIGLEHEVDLDKTEFLVQRRAHMLCDEIDELMAKEQKPEARRLLKSLLDQVLSEYSRGLADGDHALMQNTGVCEGSPIHVDVGQFVGSECFKNPDFYMQEVYTKFFKFRIWLRHRHPHLAGAFESDFKDLFGEDFETMTPRWRRNVELNP